MVVMMFRWQNKSWLVIKCFMICSWSFDIYIHHLFSFLHVMPKYIYDTRSNVNLFHQWEAISSIRNSCVLENKWWFDMIKLRLMNKYIFIHDLCTPCMYYQYIDNFTIIIFFWDPILFLYIVRNMYDRKFNLFSRWSYSLFHTSFLPQCIKIACFGISVVMYEVNGNGCCYSNALCRFTKTIKMMKCECNWQENMIWSHQGWIFFPKSELFSQPPKKVRE